MSGTVESKGTVVTRNLIADYLDIGATGVADFHLMSVFETIDENPNAQTTQKHYTADKSATTLTTGYQTQFPIPADLYKDNAVVEFIRDRLYEPVAEKENTYYARKFRVGFEISSISGAGGEIVSIDGNMNAIGDAVIGEFNTKTKTFTEAGAPVA